MDCRNAAKPQRSRRAPPDELRARSMSGGLESLSHWDVDLNLARRAERDGYVHKSSEYAARRRL